MNSTIVPYELHEKFDDFIALGCLFLSNESRSSSSSTNDRLSIWTECFSYSTASPIKHNLESLVGKGIIRTSLLEIFDRIEWLALRIYISPEDNRLGNIKLDDKSKAALFNVLKNIDVSPQAWDGHVHNHTREPFDPWAQTDSTSLFNLFNTLPSPEPQPKSVTNTFARKAMIDIMQVYSSMPDLITPLFPYQKKSAALMIQRESQPEKVLDPRWEQRSSVNGETFFYNPREGRFKKYEPVKLDGTKGGILVESMGHGKTLICIAAILATKGHYPTRLEEHELPEPLHDKDDKSRNNGLVSSILRNMNKKTVPWQTFFEDQWRDNGNYYELCLQALEQNAYTYKIPTQINRSSRNRKKTNPYELIQYCKGTIIVVPSNLVHQWASEFTKHVEEGALKIAIINDKNVPLPTVDELPTLDVLLFDRKCFEREKDQKTVQTHEYASILKKFHWLRIIVDEGHGFGARTNAAVVANTIVRAERRWIVSGTPAKDLIGVETTLPTGNGYLAQTDVSEHRKKTLRQRQSYDTEFERRSGAAKSLGTLAAGFLKVRPWSISQSQSLEQGEQSALWDEYVYRHEDYKHRTYSAFSFSLRRTLENLFIKSNAEEVEQELSLPLLTHKIVRLNPCAYDKMTNNLFVLLFTSNAITSERSDRDYLFHAKSLLHLHRLTANLRQSSFVWTGFGVNDVLSTIQITEEYLQQAGPRCNYEDRVRIKKAIAAARVAINKPGWRVLNSSEEMGVFVANWPQNSRKAWAYDHSLNNMHVGLGQIIEAQKHVNERLANPDPTSELEDAGKQAKARLQERVDDKANVEDKRLELVKSVPASSYYTDLMGLKRLRLTGTTQTSPKKASEKPSVDSTSALIASPKRKRTAKQPEPSRPVCTDHIEVGSDSQLARTVLTGTVSAKLSYLICRVSELYESEKIIIFYDGDHVAYFLSQALDLLHISHLIYAKTLTNSQRAKYIVIFNAQQQIRVLIMDIKQAAHGLNISSASRIFFVSPPCAPNIVAQAIARAHRIGQKRPVHVETLVLKGTVEEAIFDRAESMTSRDHLSAKSLEDDAGIRGILQAAEVMVVGPEELFGEGQMARLVPPQQLFGRSGRVQASVEAEGDLFAGEVYVGRPEGDDEDGTDREGDQEPDEKRLKTGTT